MKVFISRFITAHFLNTGQGPAQSHVQQTMFLFRLLRPSTLLLLCAARLIDRVELIAADSDPARIELRGYVEAVTLATASRFGAADSANHGMDGAKIIANPNVNGQFIAVYHTYAGASSLIQVQLRRSVEVARWVLKLPPA